MLNQIAERLENELTTSEAGLSCNFKPGYQAVASETEEGYVIQYFKTTEEMPAYDAESFTNITDCVKEMVKISVYWQAVETDES
jgi:hypothetical protein